MLFFLPDGTRAAAMDYAEAAYFDGYHFQHVAAYHEAHRLAAREAGPAYRPVRCAQLNPLAALVRLADRAAHLRRVA